MIKFVVIILAKNANIQHSLTTRHRQSHSPVILHFVQGKKNKLKIFCCQLLKCYTAVKNLKPMLLISYAAFLAVSLVLMQFQIKQCTAV